KINTTNEFDQSFEDYNNFNEFIAEIEELESSKMFSTDMQIFEINNSNIDNEEDTRIENFTVEIEETNSKTKTSTTVIRDHLHRHEILKKNELCKSHPEKEQIE
ncbi:5388_t:CDS:2, partial [Cetraspora pellucida]